MASTQPTTHVPHHVNTLLSHLTSRPGVQSTFILSRKDGSIIQSTGLFASSPPPSTSPSVSGEPTDSNPSHIPESQSAGVGTETDSPDRSPTTVPLPESGTSTPQPQAQVQSKKSTYQPSQAEALAARIFAFVTSATELSASFANPRVAGTENANANGSAQTVNGGREGEGTREEGDGEGSGKEDDADDVKLLRFRSKKHEVVVVPDRKYILCVVHDAASSVGAGGGGRSAR